MHAQLFLRQARSQGDRLAVAVARDAHVRALKKKEPRLSEITRCENIKRLPDVAAVHLSDETLGSYHVVDAVQPDVIVLGYDQNALKDDLSAWLQKTKKRIEIIQLPAYETAV